jgi:hypothetical protein
MKSLMIAANAKYCDELAQYVLDAELFDLISGGGVKCPACADVTATPVEGGTSSSVDCVSCA